jgi:hypothetical protein
VGRAHRCHIRAICFSRDASAGRRH